MKRQRKKLSETVSPDVLERATSANKRYNEHLDALRKTGYTIKALHNGEQIDVPVGGNIPMELSVLMVEGSSIIETLKGLRDE